LPEESDENFVPNLFSFMSDGDGVMNFADYVFIRRLNVAWKKCAIDGVFSRKTFGCGMEIAVP